MALRSANIIGSGPNGLCAAIALAQAGVAVTVFERGSTPGGAVRSGALTLPGFVHDLGSSVYPMAVASPFLRTLPLERYGLRWIEPPAPLAHPFDDGTAALLTHALADMPNELGAHDGAAWQRLFAPTVREWEKLSEAVLRPLWALPHSPVELAGFGMAALLPARMLGRAVFRGERARALWAGCAAHGVLPLTAVASSGAGLALATAGHAGGWPFAAGGAQQLTRALVAYLESLGGQVVCGAEVTTLEALPPADATLFDTSAQSLTRIAGDALSPAFRRRLADFKPGPGIFKVDWALREPIPWREAACRRAGTVHLGGTMDEIAASEDAAFNGRHHDKPFVLLTQPSLFDPTRAPQDAAGEPQHTAWAYCHVPAGASEDRTAAIEAQVERFAPGFGECILARASSNAAQLEAWDPNLGGGDITGGAMTLPQLVARPTLRLYRTDNRSIYLCSASTPPGGGVHGMCGYLAAQAALADHGRPQETAQ
jgi:phytoene dehydrogenase-like protein